jgi:hypothetical protein
MEAIEEIKTVLIPIKKVDFSTYFLKKSRSIFNREKFYFKKIDLKDLLSVNINNIYWEFNDKSFGEYCRDTISQFDKFEDVLKYTQSEFKQLASDSTINELYGIIQNDFLVKDSIYIEFESLFEKMTIASFERFQDASIDRVFNFRKQYIESIIDKIKKGLIFEIDHFEGRTACKKISERKPVKKESEANQTETEIPVKKTKPVNRILGTYGFCWNKKRDLTRDTVILHTLLKEHEFIHKDTSINSLKDAFNCKFISDPLKIEWTKKVKGKHSKGLLFHFIEQLEHFNFIDIIYQNNELFNKLSFIFCDLGGERLYNLDVSKSQWLNQRKSEKTPQEIELDSILCTLFYTDSVKSIN